MLQSVSLCGKAIKGIPLLLMLPQVLPGGSSFYSLRHTHAYPQAHTHTHRESEREIDRQINKQNKGATYFDFDLMLQAVVADIYFWHTQTHTRALGKPTHMQRQSYTHTHTHTKAHLPRLTQTAAAENLSFVLPKQSFASSLFTLPLPLLSFCQQMQLATSTHYTHTHTNTLTPAHTQTSLCCCILRLG